MEYYVRNDVMPDGCILVITEAYSPVYRDDGTVERYNRVIQESYWNDRPWWKKLSKHKHENK